MRENFHLDSFKDTGPHFMHPIIFVNCIHNTLRVLISKQINKKSVKDYFKCLALQYMFKC